MTHELSVTTELSDQKSACDRSSGLASMFVGLFSSQEMVQKMPSL